MFLASCLGAKVEMIPLIISEISPDAIRYFVYWVFPVTGVVSYESTWPVREKGVGPDNDMGANAVATYQKYMTWNRSSRESTIIKMV